MPYVSVHVDAEDVLGDLTDEQLRDELNRRAARKQGGGGYSADYTIPRGAARHALNESSDMLRKQGRNDLAFKLEEVREDYVEP